MLVQIFLLCLLNINIRLSHSESYSADMNVQNLGTAFEFKIHIDAGKEDCFYQMVEPGSSLYVAFHVCFI